MLSKPMINAGMIIREATTTIILLFVLLPIFATFAFFAQTSTNLLLATHIVSGFFWFVLVLSSPLYSILVMRDVLPNDLEKDFTYNIPNMTILAFGSGLTAVISGSLLFLDPTLAGSETGIWRTLALLLAWTIFGIGLFGPNRYHVGEYLQYKSKDNDDDRIRNLRRKNVMVGFVEATLLVGFVIFMNFL